MNERNKLEKEASKQKLRHEKFTAEGKTLIPSLTNNQLEEKIGTIQSVNVRVQGFTKSGLVILYLEGEENEKAFHLVRPKLLLKYNPSLNPRIKKGYLMFGITVVIGVRAVGEDRFVISLRLPFSN